MGKYRFFREKITWNDQHREKNLGVDVAGPMEYDFSLNVTRKDQNSSP
jgi:hypothetical protein